MIHHSARRHRPTSLQHLTHLIHSIGVSSAFLYKQNLQNLLAGLTMRENVEKQESNMVMVICKENSLFIL